MIKYLFFVCTRQARQNVGIFLYTAYLLVYLFFFLTDHIDFKVGSFLL